MYRASTCRIVASTKYIGKITNKKRDKLINDLLASGMANIPTMYKPYESRKRRNKKYIHANPNNAIMTPMIVQNGPSARVTGCRPNHSCTLKKSQGLPNFCQ